MSSLIWIIASIAIGLLFFLGIPGVGAFTVRSQWRIFRRRIQEISLYPFLNYADLTLAEGWRGRFRVFGELEAIQGRDRIWINTGSFTVEAHLEGVQLYQLPSVPAGKPLAEALPDEEPAVVPWNRVFSLPSGMKMFVGGSLFVEEGRGVFRSQPAEPLLVVSYDGERESILTRAIWGGRKKNEYWNPFTLPSILTGFFCLALLAFVLMRVPAAGLSALLALSLALAPAAPFLPPGVALYYLYTFFWKKARHLRAERDLLRLPLRYFPAGSDVPELRSRLPTGETYIMTSKMDVPVEGTPAVRNCHGIRRNAPSRLFGALGELDGRQALRAPQDPMAELVLIQGDPDSLARRCNQAAHLLELASAACMATGIGANLFLILLLLRLLLR